MKALGRVRVAQARMLGWVSKVFNIYALNIISVKHMIKFCKTIFLDTVPLKETNTICLEHLAGFR